MCWVVGVNMTSRHTNDPQNNCKRHYRKSLELRLDGDMVRPDVVGWRRDRGRPPDVHEPSSMLKLPPTVGALASPLTAVDHRACASDG